MDNSINKEILAIQMISETIKGTIWENKVFIAGGAVRDEIMGLSPKDVDLLILENAGGIEFANWFCKLLNIYKENSNPIIFPRFGTAKFILNGIHFHDIDLSGIDIECVMPRKEIYDSESRNPKVEFGNLEDDVRRRDFTVNSLLKNISTNEILDLTKTGIEDITHGIIRTPLDPDIIFSEDPLRMLRAIRFTVKFNWQLPLFMIRSIKKNAHRIVIISTERIIVELNKMLISEYPDKAVKLLIITDLSKYIIPEINNLRNLTQNKFHAWDALGHTLEVLKRVSPELKCRLAALFHDIGKFKTKEIENGEIHFYEHEKVGAEITKEILMRLKYPNDIINPVVDVVENHMRTKQYGLEAEFVTDKTLRKLQNDLGENLELLLNLIDGDNNSHAEAFNLPEQVKNIRKRLDILGVNNETKIVLPINGHEIMEILELQPGPEIKKVLDFVKEKYFENPELTKEETYKLIKNEWKKV